MAASLSAYAAYTNFLVSSPSPFVYHVEINRPAKLNAFNEEVWTQFGKLFDQISHDPEVRAVILSGSGDRAFTAGLDVSGASAGPFVGPPKGTDGPRQAKPLRAHIEDFQSAVSSVERCEKRKLFMCAFEQIFPH